METIINNGAKITYNCPICTKGFNTFDECDKHLESHPLFNHIAEKVNASLAWDTALEGSVVHSITLKATPLPEPPRMLEIEWKDITYAEMKLLSNMYVDGDRKLILCPLEENRWIAKLLFEKALENVEYMKM